MRDTGHYSVKSRDIDEEFETLKTDRLILIEEKRKVNELKCESQSNKKMMVYNHHFFINITYNLTGDR